MLPIYCSTASSISGTTISFSPSRSSSSFASSRAMPVSHCYALLSARLRPSLAALSYRITGKGNLPVLYQCFGFHDLLIAQRNLQLGNLLDFLIIQNLQIVGSNINRQVFLRLIQRFDSRFQVQLAGSDIVGNTQAVEYRMLKETDAEVLAEF